MPALYISRPNRLPSVVRIILGLLFMTATCTLLLLLDMFPYRPHSFTGWAVLIGVGVPCWLSLEWIGGIVFSNRVGYQLSDKRFSAARILCCLAILMTFYVLMFVLWKVARVWL